MTRRPITLALVLLGSLSLAAGVGAQAPTAATSAAASPTNPTAAGASAKPAPSANAVPNSGATTSAAPTSAAGAAAPSARPVNPHAGLPGGHPPTGGAGFTLVKGSPFSSDQHKLQASAARSGQKFQLGSTVQPAKMIPSGTIGVLLKGANKEPIAGKRVELKIRRQSIEEGDRFSEKEATSDAQGLTAFRGLRTESMFVYEVEVTEGEAKYTSGPFRLDREQGHVVSMYLYPNSANADDTMIVSRALYVVQPRAEAFQIQAILRIYNTNAVTWTPGGLPIPLPKDWKGFAPGETTGDLKVRQKGDSVFVDGTFAPGQHDFSFSFQLPNRQRETAQLTLPTLINLVDAKIFVEASKTMSLSVAGFQPPEETRGTDGQHALLVKADFLQTGAPPSAFVATVTGLPTRGIGTPIAFVLAAVIAIGGLGLTLRLGGKAAPPVAAEDRARAKELLLEELVMLEDARKSDRVGPKTYEQTRRLLLDSLARLEIA